MKPLIVVLLAALLTAQAPVDVDEVLESDVAFLRLPGNLEWLGFRSVNAIDRKPLDGAKSLTELLARMSADAMAQARLLVESSSKYNLGNPRTANVPTLPSEDPPLRVRGV